MAPKDRMTLNERNNYLRLQQPHYQAAPTRAAKRALLDEMQRVTGLNRSYLVQKLSRPIVRRRRSQERGCTYGPEVDAALDLIAQAQDDVCPERLKGYLLETAENLAHHGLLRLGPHLREQLSTISVSSIRRHLPPRATPRRATRARPQPNRLQREIPIQPIAWDIEEPGHCEVDLVHHGGPQPLGQYGYTLQLVDVATGWSGRRAILGRGYVVVADALYTLFQQFPFTVQELHVDNGGEFLNAHLVRFLAQFYPAIHLSRSAPGRPNDNRFVEQKNDTLVRSFVGDRRLDTVAHIRYLNTLYEHMGAYYNFWQPVMHQIAKEHLPATATHRAYTRRDHDQPRPPLERLLATPVPSQAHKQALRAKQVAMNVFDLREQIYTRLGHLFTYAPADPEQPENVYATLAYPELFPAAFAALDVIPGTDATPLLPSFPPLDSQPPQLLRKERA